MIAQSNVLRLSGICLGALLLGVALLPDSSAESPPYELSWTGFRGLPRVEDRPVEFPQQAVFFLNGEVIGGLKELIGGGVWRRGQS